MKHFLRWILMVLFALTVYGGADSWAQSSTLLRVRGRITQVAGDQLTVKSVDGRILKIVLRPEATVTAIVPARLADIKPGRFVGTAAQPEGAHWRALEVHVFPAGSRPGEGHRAWAPEPGATMTNADVTAVVRRARRSELTLVTGGQSFTIEIPRGTPVVALTPASRQQVVNGAFAYFTQVVDENGVLTAKSIAVGRNGRWPPK